jgi:DNA invertase Pin-like site-specific DNA recombinase
MSIVAIYCRKSKKDTHGETGSIEEQKTRGAEEAEKLYPDFEIEYYEDDGLSGKLPPRQWKTPRDKKFREGLTRLINDIEANKVRAVICRRIDRLARNISVLAQFIGHIPSENFDLHFVDEPNLNHITPEGRLQIGLLAQIAEYEREKIGSNIRASKRHIKNMGGKLTSAHWIVGYEDEAIYDENGVLVKKIPGGVTIEPKGRDAVIQIFDWFLSGLSYAEITRKLKDKFPDAHPPNKSQQWHQSTVKRILKSPRYKGKSYNCDNILIDSKVYDAIIPHDKWYKCAKIIEQLDGIHHRTDHGVNRLANILKCGNCGQDLVLYGRYSKTGDHLCREYKCINKNCTTRATTLRESAYIDFIYSLFFWDLKESHEKDDIGELKNLHYQLSDAKAAVETVLERVKVKPTKGLLDALSHHEKRVEEIEVQIENFQEIKTYKFYKGSRPPEDYTPLEQREKITFLIKQISTHSDHIEIELRNPEKSNEFLNYLIHRATGGVWEEYYKEGLYPKIFQAPIMLKTEVASKKHRLCLVPERFTEAHHGKLRFQALGKNKEIDWVSLDRFFPLAFNSFYFKNVEKNKKYISVKKCCQCGKLIPIFDKKTGKANYSRNKLNKDGWHSYCKTCTQKQRNRRKPSPQINTCTSS